jgi:hypothetical protein
MSAAIFRALVLPVAATAAYFVLVGSAPAATTTLSGTVANGGCDAARPVPVSGPSRIEVSLSSTDAGANNVRAEILGPNGQAVATGSYDTPGGGDYAVRVCSLWDSVNAPTLSYSGLIGTGPAGQRVLNMPADQGSVLGQTANISQTVSGKAAIKTRAGLAWFTVHATDGGAATIRLFDPVHHQTRVVNGLHAVFGTNSVRITGSGLKLVLASSGAKQQVTFTSPSFKASGKVVRGSFKIVI